MRALALLAALALVLPACDAAEPDGPTIGGTYAGTSPDGATSVRLVIPDGTPSDPDRRFAASDVAASPPVEYRGTYDDPVVRLVPTSGALGLILSCTAVRDGDVLNCTFQNGAIVALTREG